MGELVVGVDGSAGSRVALAWAVDAARVHGDDLVVATVAHPSALLSGEPGLPDDYRRRIEQLGGRRADDLLEQMLAPYRDTDASIASSVLEGATAPALIDRAAGSNGLVVGTRGHTGYRRLLLGSVSQHAVVHATVPVVVVPPRADSERPDDKVVVGVDGSDGARAAMVRAAEDALVRDAELELVMVQPPPTVVGEWPPTEAAVDAFLWATARPPADTDPGGDIERRRREGVVQWRNEMESCLADEVDRLDPVSLPEKVTRTVIGAEHTARGLLDAAVGAQLLVVGSRGHGGFAGMLLGSVGQQCARHATAPVMVVHSG